MSGYVVYEDPLFPAILKTIRSCPKKLYFLGDIRLNTFDNCLAVVGTRNISMYGKKSIDYLFKSLTGAGLTIVSGYMYGTDVFAHKSAIKYGLKTIAVLGFGLGSLDKTDEMYNEVTQSGGLFITEYENDFPAARWTFPRRNRIIAGLSRATLVVEAAEKSGSIITAEYAVKFGRKVLAIPGNIFSEVSFGTNNLLKNGAKAITSPQDIFRIFNIESTDVEFGLSGGTGTKGSETSNIINILKATPMGLDEIAITLGQPYESVSFEVSHLELSGFIFEDGGKYYAS